MRECIVLASIASRKSIAIARSIKDVLGLRVIGVAHTDHPHVFSRHLEKAFIARVDRGTTEWVRTVLSTALRHRCRAVVPIDFVDFYMFSKNKQLFDEAGIVLVSPSFESIVIASDRIKCQEALRDVAYFPSQVFVEAKEDIDKIRSLRPPLVVKNLSDNSNPSFHLDYETAVKDVLSRVPAIVQEYVEGVARGYYALAFNGVPLLEFAHQRTVEYTPIGGASLGARGSIKDPALFTLGRGIIERLRWSGIIMVETRYSDEKGTYYVIELNPKFWGSIDLPESLGYRFSALVLALYLYGYDYALELKKRLMVRDGSFVWLLDAIRYIPKIPGTWLKLAKIALSRSAQSDIELADIPRGFAQIAKAFKRFRREKEVWLRYLDKSREQLSTWINRYLQFLLSPKKTVVLDFDATIVKLPIDWARLRKKLIEIGLLYPWESINRALTRYWSRDVELYQKLSDIIKQYELNTINRAKLLVEPELLKKLSKYSKLCIATKQAVDVVIEALKMFGLSEAIDHIAGRDSGFGPLKKTLYNKCVELCRNSKEAAVVIDDNIEYLIDAYRQGYTPMHATSSLYLMAKSHRLGIPSGKTSELLALVISSIENV